MKLRKIFGLVLLSLPAMAISADDPSEEAFSEGSVLIRCGTPPGEDKHISTKLFEAAFPGWILALQKHADEGRVARAHYLGIVKEGIFIVVPGSDRAEALSNSEIVMKDLGDIMAEAMSATGETPPFTKEESCQTMEIGPVAVLPR